MAAAGTTPEHALELWTHFKRAWAPIAGLIVIAVLQNIDLIAAKHRFAGVKDLANSYAATAVAAKVLVWVAIGYAILAVLRARAPKRSSSGGVDSTTGPEDALEASA